MAQPVYKLWMAKWSEAWYQLSEDEQQQFLTKSQEALEQVGGKTIILCNSLWAAEPWFAWGVEQFPDIEALQKHIELLNEFNHFRYLESRTVLGTEWQLT